MPAFRFDDQFSRDVRDPLARGARRRLVRAAGNIRILLLGLPATRGMISSSRPVATGTFSYPSFGSN
jgi:hypothetical protein